MSHISERPASTAKQEVVKSWSMEEERLRRRQRLAAAFRIFAKKGFDQGVAGHISVRDPEFHDRYWVNAFAQHFALIKVSDLQCVDTDGNHIQGDRPINQAGFAIHSAIHRFRPDAVAIAHSHSTYGKAWSCLNRRLDPLTQDSCLFYEDHAVYRPYGGIVLTEGEGARICETLGGMKALILQNHGLLTIGPTLEAAAWWFISMDDAAHTQLLAEAAGTPEAIGHDVALDTRIKISRPEGAARNFEPLYEWILHEEPDLLG